MSDIRHYSTHPEEHTNDSFEANLEQWITQYKKNTNDSFEANIEQWITQYKKKENKKPSESSKLYERRSA